MNNKQGVNRYIGKYLDLDTRYFKLKVSKVSIQKYLAKYLSIVSRYYLLSHC